jgi:hypothetical protein
LSQDAYDADVGSLFQNQDVEGWSKEGSLRVETVSIPHLILIILAESSPNLVRWTRRQ